MTSSERAAPPAAAAKAGGAGRGGAPNAGAAESRAGKGGSFGRVARWVLPFVVSGAFFAYILSGMEAGAVVEQVTPRVAFVFGPPLVAFLALSLLIEALCLRLVIAHAGATAGLATAARIKAASYLLGLLNYALGAAGLTVLLRRRAGMTLADAAGGVLVIALFDLASLLVLVILGAGLLGADALGGQIGVVAGVAVLILAGFAFLRAPVSLGPLDAIRRLEVFRAARTLPLAMLAQLAALRFAFVALFMPLAWAILAAFDVTVPWLELVFNTSIMLLVAALPIAAAGLGTGQLVFVTLFRDYAAQETLLAASLTLSFSLIVTRAAMGMVFAGEYTREALAASRAASDEGAEGGEGDLGDGEDLGDQRHDGAEA